MKLRDVSANTIIRLDALLRTDQPYRIEKLRTEIRMQYPQISESAVVRRVVDRALNGDRRGYRKMLRRLAVRRPEPMRSSPIEQIKEKTAILNPMGKTTGGNYRASF